MSSSAPLSRGTSPSEPTPSATQPGQLPPATPAYILRGHACPVHALQFCQKNLRLLSGDAEGWVVVWDMSTKRAVAAWKAHAGAVLGVKGVGDRILTHGRDHKLQVWKVSRADEERLDKTLPVDRLGESSHQHADADPASPWLLHSLSVNALNFCAFAMCADTPIQIRSRRQSQGQQSEMENQGHQGPGEEQPGTDADSNPAVRTLLAVPNALNSGAIDIFHLPSEKRVSTIPADTQIQTGMVMAIELFFRPTSQSQGGPDGRDLYLVSGYEDGHTMVHLRRGPLRPQDLEYDHTRPRSWTWERVYVHKPHSQPVLSLDVHVDVDASVEHTAKNPYYLTSSADAIIAKHPIPVPPSSPEIKSFNNKDKNVKKGLLVEDTPLKTVNTKHAGQQGLRIRSDGRIFATAGWDSRVRVYSGKNLRELAVLKWHKEGCYAVALADVGLRSGETKVDTDSGADTPNVTTTTTGMVKATASLSAIKLQRVQRAQNTHWLAAGSKDGKISLWDIY